MISRDEQFMRHALVLAEKARVSGEVPVGAIVISPSGDIVGEGFNQVEAYQSQQFHAEAIALNKASSSYKNWRLDKCTLYVTLEPCMMCISFSALSRIERVVYGAASPLFGYRLDKEGVLALYTKQIKNITPDILAYESAELLKNFFAQQRRELQ
jgi:tRNA(adenine34) deaminase